MPGKTDAKPFWDHLDDLRGVLLRVLLVTGVFSTAAFLLKDLVFSIVLAPGNDGFVTYRLIDRLSRMAGGSELPPFDVQLINTGLARQFMIHVKMAFSVGVILAAPYIIFQIYTFVAPALYAKEKKCAETACFWGYLMFAAGLAVSYFVVFPLTFRFLGTYQVDTAVTNLISLDSYISTMLTLSLFMGIVFEMPLVAWIFARFGVVNASMLKKYRRHAIVIILTVAAIITPTTDIFTLMTVTVPLWALYEASILIVRVHGRRGVKLNAAEDC